MHIARDLFPDARRVERCPACLSTDLHPYLTGQDFHYQTPGDFATDRCRECGLIFLNPMPTPADLGRLYPDDYYSFQAPALRRGPKERARKLLGLARETHVPRFDRPGVMLDIGCGAGQYLFEQRARGWTVFGAELNRGAAEAGRRAGIPIMGGELTEAGFADEQFDFIRANHSFEHIPNPDDILPAIHRMLKRDGKLFIGVPNVDSAWAKLFGKYWWYFGLPVHTYNYSPTSLRRLLERHGFVVEEVRYNSDFAGLQGSLQIFANRHRNPRTSEGPILTSWLLRLPAHYLSRLMDLLRRGDCIEVICSKARA